MLVLIISEMIVLIHRADRLTVGQMGERNRKSIRWTAGPLLALLSLMAAGTCTIPAYPHHPVPPPPPPPPTLKSAPPPAVADDPATAPATADPESMLPHF